MEINNIKSEKNYPLTKEEFYEKVEKLLIEQYPKENSDYVNEKLSDLWETESLFMESLYGFACFTYDNPSLYGENCKKAFEDGYIKQNAVHQVKLMIG